MLLWGKSKASVYSKDDLFPKYTNRGGDLFSKYNSTSVITKDDKSKDEPKKILEENQSLFGNYLK